AEAMTEAEVEVDVEEEEGLKQEENVLKEEEDQIYQINLKGGWGPVVTQEQDREIINMDLANNAIMLREIQANIIGDNAIFNTVMCIRSLKTYTLLAHILKRHQGKMKQLYLYCIFSFFLIFFCNFVYCNCNLYWIQN